MGGFHECAEPACSCYVRADAVENIGHLRGSDVLVPCRQVRLNPILSVGRGRAEEEGEEAAVVAECSSVSGQVKLGQRGWSDPAVDRFPGFLDLRCCSFHPAEVAEEVVKSQRRNLTGETVEADDYLDARQVFQDPLGRAELHPGQVQLAALSVGHQLASCPDQCCRS